MGRGARPAFGLFAPSPCDARARRARRARTLGTSEASYLEVLVLLGFLSDGLTEDLRLWQSRRLLTRAGRGPDDPLLQLALALRSAAAGQQAEAVAALHARLSTAPERTASSPAGFWPLPSWVSTLLPWLKRPVARWCRLPKRRSPRARSPDPRTAFFRSPGFCGIPARVPSPGLMLSLLLASGGRIAVLGVVTEDSVDAPPLAPLTIAFGSALRSRGLTALDAAPPSAKRLWGDARPLGRAISQLGGSGAGGGPGMRTIEGVRRGGRRAAQVAEPLARAAPSGAPRSLWRVSTGALGAALLGSSRDAPLATPHFPGGLAARSPDAHRQGSLCAADSTPLRGGARCGSPAGPQRVARPLGIPRRGGLRRWHLSQEPTPAHRDRAPTVARCGSSPRCAGTGARDSSGSPHLPRHRLATRAGVSVSRVGTGW